ncbi:hypothetical protein [Nitrosomonas sp. Nm84]|nr:hypothetical protein [Nitrosomonas sp. Nm84]
MATTRFPARSEPVNNQFFLPALQGVVDGFDGTAAIGDLDTGFQ